jgi:energy-converting hydrogenase Eha subunit H
MVMFIVPIRIIRGYIRGRCRLLEIDVPANRAETVIQVTMRILVLTILCTLAAAGMNGFSDLMVVILLLSAVGMIANLIHARREHKRHPLYYGTLARSMVPLYALAIIFLALVVQPWLMYNEAKLLREDKVGIGYVGKATCYGGGISGVDPRVAAEYASRMRDALK